MEVKLPELGQDIEKATVSCWYVQPGNLVNLEDDIVELVTDKATFNVSAPTSGILKRICFKEGEAVKIGQTLAIIE
jgi:2-oxoglutarate dehydrogenase E2 component (dihydrolipoamide succinyltransferase)